MYNIHEPVKVVATDNDPYHKVGETFMCGKQKADDLVARGWVALVTEEAKTPEAKQEEAKTPEAKQEEAKTPEAKQEEANAEAPKEQAS